MFLYETSKALDALQFALFIWYVDVAWPKKKRREKRKADWMMVQANERIGKKEHIFTEPFDAHKENNEC